MMAGLIPFNRHGLRSNRYNDDFYNMIDDFFSDSWWPGRSLTNDTFKLDITEDDKAYYLEAELPGVKKNEVELELNEGRLTISIRREENVEHTEKKNYVHRERRYASMQRSVYLGSAKDDGISAKLEEGVLKITVPKEDKVETKRRIEIQ